MQVNLSSSSMFALSRLLGERIQSTADTSDATSTEARSTLQQAFLAMSKVLEEDAEEQKARARQKLEDAKAQIEFLRRWHFDPAVLARQAASLGISVNVAASDFMEALGETGAAGANALGTATSPSDDTKATDANEVDGSQPPRTAAERAYQEAMEDDSGRMSAQDRATLEEFKAVAQELKQLLEEAKRRMLEQKVTDRDALVDSQKVIGTLGQTMAKLDSSLSAAVVITPTISLTL